MYNFNKKNDYCNQDDMLSAEGMAVCVHEIATFSFVRAGFQCLISEKSSGGNGTQFLLLI